MNFEFATATRIVFGQGAVSRSIPGLKKMGKRALLVTGRNAERARVLTAQLDDAQIPFELFSISKEPSADDAAEAGARGREAGCDMVFALGGGSVIDTGKAAAALLANDGDVMDYLEVVGKGLPLLNPSLPFVAIPTTAGTGAEVTKNAVLSVPSHKVKVSMRSPFMLPELAVIDPLLTVSMSPETTAASGLDALTQVIEPFVSNQSNPLTDALCKEGMFRAARSLRAAFRDGNEIAAREDMCLASLFGGLALANAKLGAVHGFAGPIGGMFDAPHGELCGILLPHVTAMLESALAERAPGATALARLDETARILTGKPDARARDGVRWIRALTDELGLPSLSTFGIASADIDEIVRRAKSASSMKGSPVMFTDTELADILAAALND